MSTSRTRSGGEIRNMYSNGESNAFDAASEKIDCCPRRMPLGEIIFEMKT